MSLARLAAALLLAVICLYLIRTLASESRLEDCLLQGRTNCALGAELESAAD